MCYSVTSTVEDSSGPWLSVKRRQDVIAVTLRGFFTVSDRTQKSRLSLQSELSLSECSLAQIPQSLRYCTTIILQTPPCCLLVCFFTSVIKYQVKSRRQKTPQTREPPSWMLQGAVG